MTATTQAAAPVSGTPTLLPALREWEDRTFPDIRLSPAGRQLAKKLTGDSKARLEVTELRQGLRVRARSWVGVVRLDDVEIRIVPKLAGDHLDLVKLVEIVTGIDGLTRLAGKASLDLAGENLLDLVALLFAEACEDILRRGLLAGYVTREEALPMARGRILADRQLLARFGMLDRIECRFDELEHDVVENQLLAVAIAAGHRRVRSTTVRRRLARLRAIFDPICTPLTLDIDSAFKTMAYDRLNSHYEQAHGLARLLLEGLGLDDLLASGRSSSFAFLLDMNLLFERFVEKLVRNALPTGFTVRSQASRSSIIWNATTHRSYSTVRPDLLVERKGHPPVRLAIDAKYKLYDERRIDPSDIYQTFLYAYALGFSLAGAPPTALIIYPASTNITEPVTLRIQSLNRTANAEVIACGISIPTTVSHWYRNGHNNAAAQLTNYIGAVLKPAEMSIGRTEVAGYGAELDENSPLDAE